MRRGGIAALAVACAAGVAPAAHANVQVGSSGWEWGNPRPQGNSVLQASFAGTTGYAVGAFGTLLLTTDGGETWDGLRSGTFTNLDEVQAIDNDSLFAGGGCVGRRSDDGGKTFTRVAFTPVETSCNEVLAEAWWPSTTTGYLVLGDGTVLRTDNNGFSFGQRTAVPLTRAAGGGAEVRDLQFLSDQVGFALAGGRIFRTDDGANSWREVAAVPMRELFDISFLDAGNGVAVGADGTFLTTTDGGLTWEAQPLGGAGDDLGSVACADASTCLARTVDGRAVLRTPDGGETASRVTIATGAIFTLAFATPSRVVALGQAGTTAVSDDAGQTFRPIGATVPGSFSSVIAGAAPGSAYAVGANGALAVTTDAGRTWTRGNVPTSEEVVDVSFPTAREGFALDSDGGLFATADGGATWRTLDTGASSAPKDIVAANAQTVVVFGSFGARRSKDGGESFATVRLRGRSLTGVAASDRGGTALFGFGTRRIVVSTTGGASFRSWSLPTRRTRIQAFDIVSARQAFLLDSGGRLWRTGNAGRTWKEIDSLGTFEATNVEFGDARRGYVVIDEFGGTAGGWLLRTEDGGGSWSPQFVIDTGIGTNGLAAGPGGTDYLLGGSAALLSTRSGGFSGEPSSLSITTPRRRLSRPRATNVRGRLTPAAPNEAVTVSWRPRGATRWQTRTVRTASNGSFTTRWNVRRGDNVFVAQWAGGFRNRGDGSRSLTIRVGR